MKPQSIDIKEKEMRIVWDDGRTSIVTMQKLRQSCPCASCVHELTGEKILDDSKIPDTIFCAKAEPVGHYALALHFSDGHSTGIYSFKLLYSLRDC